MRRHALVLLVIAVFASLTTIASGTAIRNGDYEMRGKYQGVLYCSDCPGVWTVVTLEDPGPDLGMGSGTFVIAERYSGGVHGGESVVTTGTWRTLARDSWQTTGLLELRSRKAGASLRYFRCEGGRQLVAVKADGSYIQPLPKADQSYLFRVVPPVVPQFATLTESDSGRKYYGRIGDRFQIDLAPTPAPGGTPNPRPDFSVFSLTSVTQLPDVPEALYLSGRDALVDILAESPGTATLTFRSRSKPVRVVTFEFEISP